MIQFTKPSRRDGSLSRRQVVVAASAARAFANTSGTQAAVPVEVGFLHPGSIDAAKARLPAFAEGLKSLAAAAEILE